MRKKDSYDMLASTAKLEYGISLIDTCSHWQIGTLFMQNM